jgi:hypothetical protein
VSEANANLVYVCDKREIDLCWRKLRSREVAVSLGGRAFEVGVRISAARNALGRIVAC